MSVWDENAEALHGLSIDRLNRDGLQPGEVCDRLCEALDGFDVYSDAPDWDEYWMMRLFDAAGRRVSIKLFDFAQLMPMLQQSEKAELLLMAELHGARRHRAADDALYLQLLYRLTHPAAST